MNWIALRKARAALVPPWSGPPFSNESLCFRFINCRLMWMPTLRTRLMAGWRGFVRGWKEGI